MMNPEEFVRKLVREEAAALTSSSSRSMAAPTEFDYSLRNLSAMLKRETTYLPPNGNNYEVTEQQGSIQFMIPGFHGKMLDPRRSFLTMDVSIPNSTNANKMRINKTGWFSIFNRIDVRSGNSQALSENQLDFNYWMSFLQKTFGDQYLQSVFGFTGYEENADIRSANYEDGTKVSVTLPLFMISIFSSSNLIPNAFMGPSNNTIQMEFFLERSINVLEQLQAFSDTYGYQLDNIQLQLDYVTVDPTLYNGMHEHIRKGGSIDLTYDGWYTIKEGLSTAASQLVRIDANLKNAVKATSVMRFPKSENEKTDARIGHQYWPSGNVDGYQYQIGNDQFPLSFTRGQFGAAGMYREWEIFSGVYSGVDPVGNQVNQYNFSSYLTNLSDLESGKSFFMCANMSGTDDSNRMTGRNLIDHRMTLQLNFGGNIPTGYQLYTFIQYLVTTRIRQGSVETIW